MHWPHFVHVIRRRPSATLASSSEKVGQERMHLPQSVHRSRSIRTSKGLI